MEKNFFLLVGTTIVVAFLLSFVLRKLIKLFTTRTASKIQADATSFSFLKNSVSFFIYSSAIIFILYHIPSIRQVAGALFAGAGILAAIIGFAAQKAFSNIIGGIFILIFRPFRVGDIIYIGTQHKGIVEEITLRHIIIRNYENRRIIIPNGIISDETIVNSSISDERIKKHIEFGISYDSDIDSAIEIIRSVAENHPLCYDNRTEDQKQKNIPIVTVRVIKLDEYAIILRAYVWALNNDNAFVINCDMNYTVKKRFDAAGIEIPFPYRNIIIKSNKQKRGLDNFIAK